MPQMLLRENKDKHTWMLYKSLNKFKKKLFIMIHNKKKKNKQIDENKMYGLSMVLYCIL